MAAAARVIWLGVIAVSTRIRRVKRTDSGLFSRRATKPRSDRYSAANTASSTARRPASSVTRVPESPRPTRTTSPPTSETPRPLASAAAAAPSATARTSTLAGSAAGSGTVPSLATITRAPGTCASCLMARSTMVRPATRRDAPACSARVAATTRGAGGAGSEDGISPAAGSGAVISE